MDHIRHSKFCLGAILEHDTEGDSETAIPELVQVLFRGGYNFGNIIRKNKNKTIESRLHEGTLDTDHLERWARVCEGLVRYARDTSLDDAAEFLGITLRKL